LNSKVVADVVDYDNRWPGPLALRIGQPYGGVFNVGAVRTCPREYSTLKFLDGGPWWIVVLDSFASSVCSGHQEPDSLLTPERPRRPPQRLDDTGHVADVDALPAQRCDAVSERVEIRVGIAVLRHLEIVAWI
jgi:hypothetical protein